MKTFTKIFAVVILALSSPLLADIFWKYWTGTYPDNILFHVFAVYFAVMPLIVIGIAIEFHYMENQ